MPKKILDKWRDNIAFEFRDNTKYWKEERKSMTEADFLKYKRERERLKWVSLLLDIKRN